MTTTVTFPGSTLPPTITTPPVTGTSIVGTTNGSTADPTYRLTFVGPVSDATWRTLRDIVVRSGDDTQAVSEEVAKIAVGDPVAVTLTELDDFSGIGFAAGAGTSQPLGVARSADGQEVLVYAFSVSGSPEITTIVGFERGSGRVVLVDGPLPIDDSTQNITTVPGG